MGAEHRRAPRRRAWLRRVAPALLLTAVIAGCDAPSTNGPRPVADYPVGVSYWDPAANELRLFLYHWPLGAAVRVYVDARTPVTAPPLGPAVDAGARKWESQLFYREVSLRRTESVADADVVVHYDVTPPLVDAPAGCDRPFIQAAAATFFCPTDDFAGLETLPLTGGATPGHVKMEVIVVASRIADQAQLDRVVAHEIGHVFGIGGHSGDPADLMYPAPEVDAPSAADGRSLRYALHQPGAVTP